MSFKWLQAQLGHSDLKTTMDTYGHFEAATKKAVATSLEGAFQL
jgi:integrase